MLTAVTAAAAVSIPLATSSGEGLEHRLPRTALLETHAHLGDELLVFVAGMLVALVAVMVLNQRGGTLARPEGPGTMTAPRLSGRIRLVAGVLAGLAVVFAVVSAVQVYRIGDSGARAAWSDKQYVTPVGRRAGESG
jgi:hypothetical protein